MIDNGDGVDISQLNSDEQQITLTNDTLSIENGNYVHLDSIETIWWTRFIYLWRLFNDW